MKDWRVIVRTKKNVWTTTYKRLEVQWRVKHYFSREFDDEKKMRTKKVKIFYFCNVWAFFYSVVTLNSTRWIMLFLHLKELWSFGKWKVVSFFYCAMTLEKLKMNSLRTISITFFLQITHPTLAKEWDSLYFC